MLMNHEYYERKINDIINKCPIEAGVEILVYNLLDAVIGCEDIVVVDISRLRKNKDERLETNAGICDIAVVSADFKYKESAGSTYGFIEVKASNCSLRETKQTKGQRENISHFIYTNGLVWRYYKKEKEECEWEIVIATLDGRKRRVIKGINDIRVDSERFTELVYRLKEIKWAEKTN